MLHVTQTYELSFRGKEGGRDKGRWTVGIRAAEGTATMGKEGNKCLRDTGECGKKEKEQGKEGKSSVGGR